MNRGLVHFKSPVSTNATSLELVACSYVKTSTHSDQPDLTRHAPQVTCTVTHTNIQNTHTITSGSVVSATKRPRCELIPHTPKESPDRMCVHAPFSIARNARVRASRACSSCVCVCVCACVRACVRLHACVCARKCSACCVFLLRFRYSWTSPCSCVKPTHRSSLASPAKISI